MKFRSQSLYLMCALFLISGVARAQDFYMNTSSARSLGLGGVYVASRQQSAARALRQQAASMPASAKSAAMQQGEEEDEYAPANLVTTPAPTSIRAASAARPTSMLLEGLKEELFQLEVERRQGQISQSEYEKAKSALDQTLERALKREAQKA